MKATAEISLVRGINDTLTVVSVSNSVVLNTLKGLTGKSLSKLLNLTTVVSNEVKALEFVWDGSQYVEVNNTKTCDVCQSNQSNTIRLGNMRIGFKEVCNNCVKNAQTGGHGNGMTNLYNYFFFNK